MVTETSRQAYHSLGPTLGREQLRVLRLLKEFGPGTAKEIAKASGEPITIQKRLSELVERGLAVRLTERRCFVSGKSATVWSAKINEVSIALKSIVEPRKAVAARPVAHSPSPVASPGSFSCPCGTVNPCVAGLHCQAPGHSRCDCQPSTQVNQ